MAAPSCWLLLLTTFGLVAPSLGFNPHVTYSSSFNPLLAAAAVPERRELPASSHLELSSSRGKECPRPAVLSRLTRHQIKAGETVEGIAQQYDLIPATLMGLNPALRQGKVPVGSEIAIPPYNGILVKASPGQTIRDIAAVYRVRPDVLYEMNGCQASPKVVFVPGVNWSPAAPSQNDRGAQVNISRQADLISHYPLPYRVPVTSGYGWRVDPVTSQVAFHSGVDLEAPAGTAVLAAANGIVAFAGKQGDYGNLIVINHPEGRQTRYAQLGRIAVSAGRVIKQGTPLGTVGATGLAERPHLHFEIRANSAMGWVAQDPTPYLRATRGVRSKS